MIKINRIITLFSYEKFFAGSISSVKLTENREKKKPHDAAFQYKLKFL
jgi:hypothetical protein